MQHVPAAQLQAFGSSVLMAHGMPAADAAVAGEALVWRDLRDETPLGLAALPSCVESIRSGTTVPDARPLVTGKGAGISIDAQRGWGQVVAPHAMRLAIAAAREHGVGMVSVRNASTANAMGYYPTLAIEAGLIGLVATNSPPYQAPWGGTTKVLGNQAFAFGAPAGRHHPILFDGSTTTLSASGIRKLMRQGRPLPEGAALDKAGGPTTDPAAALAGMLLPMGGHKGYALTVMWEILTGVLAGGARFGAGVRMGPGEPMDTSLFLLAIDPELTMPRAEFAARVDALIDQLHASPPAFGVERVLVPGERGYLMASRRVLDGVPLPPARIAELTALGTEAGIRW